MVATEFYASIDNARTHGLHVLSKHLCILVMVCQVQGNFFL